MTTLYAGSATDRAKLLKVLGLSKKPSKYKNRITYVDGKRFQSKREADHYLELKLLEELGKISDLKCQVRYELRAAPLHPGDKPVKIFTYIADFDYIEKGQLVTEDVKGCITTDFKLKAKIFAANYGREIRIVK